MNQLTLLDGGSPASGAEFSACGRYRYRLWRRWGTAGRRVSWIMLNPSTADATSDDPTIRRCIGFSRAWSFDCLEVVNLFGLRSTDPAGLEHVTDPVGPGNDVAIDQAVRRSQLIVCAWGAHQLAQRRGREVAERLGRIEGRALHCLGITLHAGAPCHPLYVRGDTPLIPFRPWARPSDAPR